jgi:IS30 family transposase
MAAQNSSIATCPNTADAAGRAAFAGLSQRPERISERAESGHWECDLMMFRKEHGKVNVTSLVERVSRYAVVMPNEDRQSKPIM